MYLHQISVNYFACHVNSFFIEIIFRRIGQPEEHIPLRLQIIYGSRETKVGPGLRKSAGVTIEKGVEQEYLRQIENQTALLRQYWLGKVAAFVQVEHLQGENS